MENLYETEREMYMDIQLSVTECDICGEELDPMKSIPVKMAKLSKYGADYIFICRGCK
jgi:hypothetical protein